jgi:hypothetical protein
MGDLPGSPSVAPSAPFLHASGAREKTRGWPSWLWRHPAPGRRPPLDPGAGAAVRVVDGGAFGAAGALLRREKSAVGETYPGWARNLRLCFSFSGSVPCSTTVSPSPDSIPFSRTGFQTWPGLVSARWKDNRSSETNAAPSVAAELTPFFSLFGSAPYSAPVSSTLDAIPCPNRSLSLAEPRLYEAWHRRTMTV